MSNMAYCRFENTLADLQDCYEVFSQDRDLSERELRARLDMIRLAVEIALEYGDEIGREVEEV